MSEFSLLPASPSTTTSTVSRWAAGFWNWLRRNVLLVVAFFAVVVVYATMSFPEVFTARPEAHGDGTYYYAWARSLGLDGDVDMANDYQIVGNQTGYGRHAKTGHFINTFPMGTGVLQVPTVWLARGLLPLTNRLGWTRDDLQGGGIAFQRIAQSSSAILGFLSIVLGILVARRFVPYRAALVGGLGVLFASPLLWYMWRQPCYSHATDAFVIALFVYWWWRTYGSHGIGRWFGIGFLLGLAALVRTQNVTQGVVVAIEGIGLAAACYRTRTSFARWLGYWLVRLSIFAAGFLVAFLPQMLSWHYMFGRFVTIPQGDSYMVWNASRWMSFLFSARFGLFAWHPLLSIAALGIAVPIVRRSTPAPLRRLLIGSLAAFAVSTLVNGTPEDWWGHWSFGGRRATGEVVFFVLGLSLAVVGIAGFLERRGRWLLRAAPVALVAACAWFNFSLMDDYLLGKAKHEDTQSMKPLWMSAIGKAVDGVYSVTGNWGSIPDNWRFALSAGVSPERYDVAAASDFYRGAPFTIPLSSDTHAMGGFGAPATLEARPCRWVDGASGHFVFVVRRPAELKGTVAMAPAVAGTKVRMRVGNAVVLSQELAAGFHDYPIAIPKSRSSGVVVVDIEQILAPSPAVWPVGRSPSTLPYEVELESSGFGYGSRVSLNQGSHTRVETERGLHLFVLDPALPSVRRWERFDTHRNAAEVARFATVVAGLPAGTVVAVASAYDAASAWSAVGDQALSSVGATASLGGKAMHGFALLGVKGAAPGTAAEMINGKGPARVVVGRPVAERHDGVAYDRAVLSVVP